MADGSMTDKGKRADKMPSGWSAVPLHVGLLEIGCSRRLH